MTQCFRCRGRGMPEGCPDCGTKSSSTGKTIQETLTDEELEKLQVPDDYKAVEWSVEELRLAHPERSNDQNFNRLLDQCNKIVSAFRRGSTISSSAIVIAPPKHGKTIWSYSILKAAERAGMKTFPILDTDQMKRFIILSEQGRDEEAMALTGHNYQDLMTADIVVMKVSTALYTNRAAYEVILSLLDKRSRMGKPTIITSRYSLKHISYYDRYGEFDSILTNDFNTQGIKYPIIVYGGK